MTAWMVTLLLLFSCAAQAGPCEKRLNFLSGPFKDSTESLISYLNRLIDQQVIGHKELQALLLNLQEGKVVNPLTDDHTQRNSAAMVHRGEIAKQIRNPSLDLNKLLTWVRKLLEEKDRVRVVRDDTREKTEDAFFPMQFHRINPGRFLMGREQVEVELTHPFEMMSAPVTQKQWVDLMGTNPSQHVYGPDSIEIAVNGKTIKMRPDNPVEMVNWWSAIVFAHRLSIKAGLKPAYDLSDWKNITINSAESGDLVVMSGDVKLRGPNIYETEGYRLPTEAEFEYVLRLAEKSNEIFPYHSYSQNPPVFGRSTNSVDAFDPSLIGSSRFYNLLGNVWEWTQDIYGPLKPDINPIGAKVTYVQSGPTQDSSVRALRGNWSGDAFASDLTCRGTELPINQDSNLGFRLVRTLK